MANIKSKERSVHKKRNRLISDSIIAYLFSAFIPILGIVEFKYMYMIQLAIITFIICFIQVTMFKIKILNKGIKGEKQIYKILKKLSNEYNIYNDITLWDGHKGAQIDHLILSPYGILNIETKNMTGEIIGDEDEDTWVQKKFSKSGSEYSNKFKNPCIQGKEHERVLKNFLKNNGIKEETPIKSIIVFNENVGGTLKVTTRSIKVLKSTELFSYINEGLGKTKALNNETVDKISEIFDKRIEGRK
ncbi:nuclease-related domain-containing protein [Clostridium grantii]|uniref:Nuclease-related domain-containing protein n=1 Tax=Clostridium grantii DSM 8605 TaxID=1121316 RepID=A0A1M5TFT5_9CLOT|nr:nuclease-related domain-containing protein [Clostridium grantii]SHH49521.1 Nuclease-related domain-containing protein [Clostridium grantii DSM 8605]